MSEKIDIGKDVQSANNEIAKANRTMLTNHDVWCVNIMSSPGSGKTTLVEETIRRLKSMFRIGVIAGDLETDQDAQRAAKAGAVQAEQIETNGACHMTATMARQFLRKFDLPNLDVLIIENVGNLVCPISWDLGEHDRAVLISIPEGDDKPSKYPNCCIHTNLMLLTKIDTIDAFDFNVERATNDVQRLNPHIEVIQLSAKTGKGMDNWTEWIKSRVIESHK